MSKQSILKSMYLCGFEEEISVNSWHLLDSVWCLRYVKSPSKHCSAGSFLRRNMV